MDINKNEVSKNKIIEIKKEIVNYINFSFDKLWCNMNIYKDDIYNWKNSILIKILKEFETLMKIINDLDSKEKQKLNNKYKNLDNKKLFKDTQKLNQTIKEYNIVNTQKINNFVSKDITKKENTQKLDFFTSKDIQDENKEMTLNFQKEAYSYMNDKEDEIENENVALFFKEVAEISRKSYFEANNLFKFLFEKFDKNERKQIIISLDDEQNRKEFSSWVKQYEKNNYHKFLNETENYKEKENQKFLTNLFPKLKRMYLHCLLSFPLVEISFEKEEIFNPDKMIDFINRGNNRKVNFVILPSLFSNGNFLQNGKSWVFTYKKNTFKFEDSELADLNKFLKINDFHIPNLINNLKLTIYFQKKGNYTYVVAKPNLKISEDIKCTYCFHIIDKNNIIKKETIDKNFLKLPKNFKTIKCVLILGKKNINSNVLYL